VCTYVRMLAGAKGTNARTKLINRMASLNCGRCLNVRSCLVWWAKWGAMIRFYHNVVLAMYAWKALYGNVPRSVVVASTYIPLGRHRAICLLEWHLKHITTAQLPLIYSGPQNEYISRCCNTTFLDTTTFILSKSPIRVD